MNKIINRLFYNLSLTIFGILTLTFLMTSVGFIFRIPVNIFDLFIPFGLGVFYLFKKSDTKKEFLIQLILLFVIIAISYGISLTFWDDTWDGRAYHSAAIIMLKNGWLPLFDNIAEITQKLSLYPYNTQFSDIYLKFSEIIGANIYNLTGHIESPKTSNLLFLCSVFMYSFSLLNKITNKTASSIILSVCICLNLPCVYQLLTNYVDIQIYFAFTFLIFTVLKIEKSSTLTKTDTFMLVMSSLMLSAVKLSGLAYTFIIYFCWGIFRILRKKEVKSIVISAFSALVLILITCINPFYTNFKNHSHPFYPVMGKDKFDVLEFQYPSGFKNKSRLERFIISTFSESTNSIENHAWTSLNQPAYWKIPFTRIKDAPLSKFEYPDMRIGGFGYYWSGILCLTFLLFFFLRFNSKEDKYLYIFLLFTVTLTVAINPHCWWARFVPQFWLIVIFTLASVFSDNIKFPKFAKSIAYICIFFIFYNATEPLKNHFYIKFCYTNYYKNLYNSIKNETYSNSVYFMQNRNYNSNLADETIKIHLKENKTNLIETDFDKDEILKNEYISLQQFNKVYEEYYFYKPVSAKDDKLRENN